jgi:DNA primase
MTSTYVADAPNGLDPCDLRGSQGDSAVRDLVARRQPLVEFALRVMVRDYDLDSADGQVKALERTAPLVAKIRDVALRHVYAARLTGYIGLDDPAPVVERVRRLAGDPRPRSGRRAPAVPGPDDPAVAVEREVLKLAVQLPQLAGPVFDAIEESAFTEPTYAAIRRAMAGAGGAATATAGPRWVERIGEFCPDLLTRSTVTELAVERPRTAGSPDERYVAAQLSRLQELAVARRIKALRSRLQRVNPLESPDEHTRLFGELVALEQYGRGLREQALGTQ